MFGIIYPSTDYFNCGFAAVLNAPYPCASGSGCIGFNYASSFTTAAEMFGTFVNLTAGVFYTFSVKLRLDPGVNFNNIVGNLPSMLVLAGNTASFPVVTSSSPNLYCPSGYTMIGSIFGSTIQALDNSNWQTFSFNFVPTTNYNSIIIGGVCSSNDIFYLNADDVSITQACVSSVAPSSVSSTINCPGANRTLTVNGGSVGTGASWHWYTGSCGGTDVGTGTSITVNPSSSTVYYVRAEGTCNTTSCASATISIPSNTGTYTWDGSSNNDWHEPCNWNTNKVPTSASDVSVPGGTPNNPRVKNSNAGSCKTLTVDNANGGGVEINTVGGASLSVMQ